LFSVGSGSYRFAVPTHVAQHGGAEKEN